MSIQLSIIEALEASRSAILTGLEEVKTLRAERLAMEAKAAALEAQIACLQAESAKIVDPEAVQPLLDELARDVEETYAVVTPVDRLSTRSTRRHIPQVSMRAS